MYCIEMKYNFCCLKQYIIFFFCFEIITQKKYKGRRRANIYSVAADGQTAPRRELWSQKRWISKSYLKY